MLQKNYSLQHSLNVTFWLRKVGKVYVVYCSISINGNRANGTFSTGIKIEKFQWCENKQRIKNSKGVIDKVLPDNIILDQHYNNIKMLFLQLTTFEVTITANNLRECYLYVTKIERVTLLNYAQIFVKEKTKLAGKSIAKTTAKRVKQWFYRFSVWLEKRNLKNLLLSEVKVKHLKDFIDYQLTEASFTNHGKFKIGYENEVVQKDAYQFKTLLKKAYEEEIITKNVIRDIPVALPKKNKQITFLESWELDKIANYHFASETLQKAADLFVFQCYTGFAYKDAITFDETEHTFLHNGKQWICKERAKTSSESLLPFFANAKIRYKKGLSKISNGKYNCYLKEIANIVGIKKRLTTHVARKTAAMLFLENGCNLDTIAKMCGHLNTEVTKKYYTRMRVESLETKIPVNHRLNW